MLRDCDDTLAAQKNDGIGGLFLGAPGDSAAYVFFDETFGAARRVMG